MFCREIIAVYRENYTVTSMQSSLAAATNVIFHFGPAVALGMNTGTFISIWRVSLSGALNAESSLRQLEEVGKRKYSRSK